VKNCLAMFDDLAQAEDQEVYNKFYEQFS
jgi:hypothetical protein